MWRAVSVVAALAVAGCGGSGISTADLAGELENGDWGGATVSNVTCAKKDTRVYTCMGDYTATRKSVSASMDTSDFTAADWDALIGDQRIGGSWEVTVHDDGTWIAEPN
jgi:hypothetical protein